MDIEQYPTKAEVLKSIRRLKRIKFPKYKDGDEVSEFVNEISNILLNEFGFMISPKRILKTNEFLSNFFRVREFESFTNVDLIREHSYPPIEKVKISRCNFPKFPVFYCSNNPLTALLEVVRNFQGVKNEYCISKWELIPSTENLIFENFLQVDLPTENKFNKIKDVALENISTPFEKSFNKKLSKDQEDGIIEYLRYLDGSFINDDDYSLSATLAHRTLYVDHDFRTDILMYPSVQTNLRGTNLAIQPNFVENNMKLTRLYILSFESYDPLDGKIDLTFKKYGIVEKNIIKWKNISPTDNYYTQLIKDDFGISLNGKYIELKNSLL